MNAGAIQRWFILMMFSCGGASSTEAQTWEATQDNYMSQALNHALEKERSGTAVSWSNPTNGHRGYITPFSAANSGTGEPCRGYKKTWFNLSATTTYEGVACRSASGIWDIREERQVQSEPEGGAMVTGARDYTPDVQSLNVSSLPETIGIEWQDRINRIRRLSGEKHIRPPEIQEDLQVNPDKLRTLNRGLDVDFAVPVIRIVYKDRVFFDHDRDEIRPDGRDILDVIAESMLRDTSDTQLLVVGHTDSTGSEDYNGDLARRRGANVMRELVRRGVSVHQLATTAMGERQPIATNATEDGRSLNRRVEFMISRFSEANVALVEERRINVEWIDNDPLSIEVRRSDTTTIKPPNNGSSTLRENEVSILRPQETIATAGSTQQAVGELNEIGTVEIRPPEYLEESDLR